MPASWPGTLPQNLQISGNLESMPDGRLKSQTDTGPGKMRPRSSALARPLAGVMFMSAAQLAILDTFVTTTLSLGTLPFTFPATYGGGTFLVRFGAALPSWANQGADLWAVNMALEVLP